MRELPAQFKEYPEAVAEGLIVLGVKANVQLCWLQEEERGECTKNPSRERQLFKICYRAKPEAFSRLKETEGLLSELNLLFKPQPREKLLEQVFTGYLENFGEAADFLLRSISHGWIDALSNIRIRRFQDEEDKKDKKKRKQKNKKKKEHQEILNIGEREASFEPSTVDKIYGDDDTKCAHTTHLSLEKNELHPMESQSDNYPTEEIILELIQPEVHAKNLIKKKITKTKEDHKREKRRLKKKQKCEAARLKKIASVESSSDSISCYSPLENASRLSVAGSGVMAVSEDHFLHKAKALTSCNLILKHKHSFFDEEEVVEAEPRCHSLCKTEPSSGPFEDRCLSSDTKKKITPLLHVLKDNQPQPFDKNPFKLSDFTLKSGTVQKPPVTGVPSLQNKLDIVVGRKKSNSLKPTETETALFCSPKLIDKPKPKKPLQSLHRDRGHESSAADFTTHYKRTFKGSQTTAAIPSPEQLDINSRYKRRPANSTASDKNSQKFRGKMEKAREKKLEEPLIGNNLDESSILSFRSRYSSQPLLADQLILSEKLGLPQLLDNNGIAFNEQFIISSFHMPYLVPVKEEMGPVPQIPYEVLAHPVVAFLSTEAQRFVDYMLNYSRRIEKVRQICKERVEMVARESFMGTDDLQIKTYGSWDTGLSIPSSDIDLLVSTPGVDRELSVRMLEFLEDNMRDFAWASNIRNILSAQIPVLKIQVDASIEFTRQGFPTSSITEEFLISTNQLVDQGCNQIDSTVPTTHLCIDIIVETPDISALQTTQYVKNSIARWPELQGLVLMLKCFLYQKGLTNPYTGRRLAYLGGLSSYAISLLVEAWLERQKTLLDYRGCLYMMFKDLINFYGYHFNHTSQSIWLSAPLYL